GGVGRDDALPRAGGGAPPEGELAAAELSEPKLAPAEPPTEIHASRTDAPAEPAEEDEEDEEFWSDQRLSEELDQALESPLTDEHEAPIPPAESAAPLHDAEEDLEDEEDDAPRP